MGVRWGEVGEFGISLKLEATGFTDGWRVGVSDKGVKDETRAPGLSSQKNGGAITGDENGRRAGSTVK